MSYFERTRKHYDWVRSCFAKLLGAPHFLIQLLDRFNVTFLLKNNVSRTATSPAAAMAPLTVRRIRMTEA
jgi:hypothetical protein